MPIEHRTETVRRANLNAAWWVPASPPNWLDIALHEGRHRRSTTRVDRRLGAEA
jgi:hypothetical protein